MTVLAADLERGDEIPDGWYPVSDAMLDFPKSVNILGERERKEIIPILNRISSSLDKSADNLDYLGEQITKLDEEYGEGKLQPDTIRLGESFLDIPMLEEELPDGSWLDTDWPPNGNNCLDK